MVNPFWPKALTEACLHAYHPALHSQTEDSIVMRFLWRWEDYPSPLPPPWEQFVDQERDYERRSAQDIFPILQRAVTEGDEEDRVFALFLLGGLATPTARDLLISFLESPCRKERWASTISLGRLKEERVFALLQALLLEGFAANEIFERIEEFQAAQQAGRLYRRTLEEQGQAQCSETFYRVNEHLRDIDYEWYMRQRSECALILGVWGNPAVVPKLREALEAVWRMEQDWPNYEGPDESGPAIWYFFQDRLVFTLGQFGVWDALAGLSFPETNLLVARIYLILGALQAKVPDVFWEKQKMFRYYLGYGLKREEMVREEANPLVESVPVKRLLAEHFGLSPAAQEEYLLHFFKASLDRAKKS